MQRRDFIRACTFSALGMAAFGTGLAHFASHDSLGHTAKNTKRKNLKKVINGAEIIVPPIAFGTARMAGKEAQASVECALECGYRFIDTAQMYGNEKEVGAALKTSKIAREQVFIQSKLSSDMTYKQARAQIDNALKNLGLDYLDSMLIHAPYTQAREMYRALQDARKSGIVLNIGASNFYTSFYKDFVDEFGEKPAFNQCETHIFCQQKNLRAAMGADTDDTALQAWSPLVNGSKELFTHPVMQAMAQKYGKTPAQIALRFLTQQDIIAVVKSSKKPRMIENISIFDFDISESDMRLLADLDRAKTYFGWYKVE